MKAKRDFKAKQKQGQKMVRQTGTAKDRMKAKIGEKLMSSKFRMLNEQLYKTGSANAVDLFKENRQLFEDVSGPTSTRC